MLPQGPNMHAFLFQMTMKEPSHTKCPCLVYNEETQQCILRGGKSPFYLVTIFTTHSVLTANPVS